MRRSVLLSPGMAQRGRRHAAALAAAAIAMATCHVTAPAAGASAASAAAAQPGSCPVVAGQPSGGGPRIMIVGDSITKGSSGDYTWQYLLYKHLRADGVSPQMVGP